MRITDFDEFDILGSDETSFSVVGRQICNLRVTVHLLAIVSSYDEAALLLNALQFHRESFRNVSNRNVTPVT